MTRPMMSIETVKKAEGLIQRRGRIVAAKWDHVAEQAPLLVPGHLVQNRVPADEQLQSAIEAFRKRQLDAIDAQLRELGVDPTEQDSAA